MGILSKIRDQHDLIYKAALFVACIATIVYFFPKEAAFKYDFQKNKPWYHNDLLAPYDIPVYRTDKEIEEEQSKIKSGKKLYFSIEKNQKNKVLGSYKKILDAKWDNFIEKNNKSLWNIIKSQKSIDEQSIQLKQLYIQFASETLNKLYNKGVLEPSNFTDNLNDSSTFYVLKNKYYAAYSLDDIYTGKEAYELITNEIKNQKKLNQDFLQELFDELNSSLLANIKYNNVETEKMLKKELDQVERVVTVISKHSSIIRTGDIIDQTKYQILKSFQKKHQSLNLTKQKKYTIAIGQAVLVSILIACLVFYLIFFRPEIINENKNIVFLLITITSVVVLTSLILQYEVINVYVVPLCIAPIVVRSFFDSRTAFFIHLTNILLLGFNMPNGFHFVFMQAIAGLIGIYGFVNFRNRSQLFFTTLAILVAYWLTYTALNIIIEGDFEKIDWYSLGWLSIAALLTLLAYPIIYIFEKIFGYISDVTLLELADTNNKLLRELSRKAPGTFQHSLQVANLAEAAIQKIGGNSLLIRTAALYHDIGKMEAPMYFIENQSTGVNPHDELSYEESAQIIINHVIAGIEIAKKNNLPDNIIDFIRTHHGTTKTGYFYRMYMDENPEDEGAAKMFTYPGPIPFSKETAVLMMADSVEAASRSIKEPNAEKIDALVEAILGSQIKEEQFINANITLKDISSIKKMFKKMLMNIYHVRIEYPH